MNTNQLVKLKEWKPLFRLGAIGALITALFIPLQAIVFITWPPPFGGPIIKWFNLFQKNWLIGLLNLDLLLIVDYILLIPIILSLFIILKRTNKWLMCLSLALYVVSICTYFSSNTAFEMLSLSRQYIDATTEAQKSLFLIAGQSMMSTFEGTAFHISYILGQLSGIIISILMLKSKIFSKTTAYAGILGNFIGYGLYLPNIGIYISLFSVLGLWIWYILLSKKLFSLSK